MRQSKAEHIAGLLWNRGTDQPQDTAFVFLRDGETEQCRVTFRELDLQAKAVAATLQDHHVAIGDRVLLCCSEPRDYIPALFGCAYAGAIPVPACSPRTQALRARLDAIARNCQPTIILRDEVESIRRNEAPASPLNELPSLVAREAARQDPTFWRQPNGSQSVALLQYTSGATSAPKAVVLAHEHLLYNQQLIQRLFATGPDTVIVSWLPLYHDMGLLGAVLHSVYAGARCVLMTPEAFIQKPRRWLEAIGKYHATVSGGPNFAYDLCVRRIRVSERRHVDLRSWRVAFNGSEPVLESTLTEFASAFSDSGFRSDAFVPCYGLAEAALLVTGRRCEEGWSAVRLQRPELERNRATLSEDGGGVAVVNCGKRPELDIRIVAPESFQECGEGEIGEIWVSGNCIGDRYWGDREATAEIFAARCSSSDARFLRTGDLGFKLNGDLFITGRLNNVIIVRGKNHRAEDLEVTASRAHPALRGACAAFGIEANGTKEVVVVAEVRRLAAFSADEVAAAVKHSIAAEHDLAVRSVIFTRPGTIPRTSSGKIRRHSCRAELLAGKLHLIARVDNPIPSLLRPNEDSLGQSIQCADEIQKHKIIEEHLKGRLAAAANVPLGDLCLDRPVNTFCLDSLKAAELQGLLEAELGVSLESFTFLRSRTLRDIANDLSIAMSRARRSHASSSANESESGDIVLSPEQERLWAAHRSLPDGAALNLTAVFHLQGLVNQENLREAICNVAQQHRALRTRLIQEGGKPVGKPIDDVRIDLPLVEIDGPLNGPGSIDQLIETSHSTPFDLAHEPLLRTTLARQRTGEYFLVVTMHHIISDLWSFAVFARDVTDLYCGRVKDWLMVQRAEANSTAYAAEQRSRVPSEQFERQLRYWRDTLQAEPPSFHWHRLDSSPSTTAEVPLIFPVPGSTSEKIEAVARECGATRFVVLLATLNALLSHLSESEEVAVAVPVRGRTFDGGERLIGLFAHPVPILSTVRRRKSFLDLVKQTQDSVLRAISCQDVPFTRILEYIKPASSMGSVLPILFTYFEVPSIENGLGDFHMEPCSFKVGSSGFELLLAFETSVDGNRGVLTYDGRKVTKARAQLFGESYIKLLEAAVTHPAGPIDALLPLDKAAPALPDPSANLCSVVVAGSFTAEMLEAPLRLWLDATGISSRISFAPGGQLFQQLLDPVSPVRQNRSGFNVLLARVSDLTSQINDHPSRPTEILDFVRAVSEASEGSPVPYVVCLCPEIDSANVDSLAVEGLDKLRSAPNVILLSASEIFTAYPIADYADVFTDRLAAVPYKRSFFAALAAMIVRKVYTSQQGVAAKMIIVDADGTLWGGTCAEDGPEKIEIRPEHDKFQRLLLDQQKLGVLLCLCSKNRDEDIGATFARHTDMPLLPSHFAARRINWQPKSENVHSLLCEFSVAPEACVFIDDDPVECADVRINCPGVRALALTPDIDRCGLIQRLWALDHEITTAEDRSRTSFYAVERSRRVALSAAPSLEDFVDALKLEVDIAPIRAEQVARVSQLTFRTNQFNCTGIRCKEGDLRPPLPMFSGKPCNVLTIQARDRFGDYGLVGALAYLFSGDDLHVLWWVLSCRALGRGLEHRTLAHTGRLASEASRSNVIVSFQETSRNHPARAFLESLPHSLRKDGDGKHAFVYSADAAATCRFGGGIANRIPPSDSPTKTDDQVQRSAGGPFRGAHEPLELQMLEAAQIAQAAAHNLACATKPKSKVGASPRTPTERKIAAIWTDVLGLEGVGLNTNFFDAGGQSLAAIQILSRIRDTFGVELPIVTLFDSEITVADLAKAVEAAQIRQSDQHAAEKELAVVNALTDDEVRALLSAETDSSLDVKTQNQK